MRRIVSTTIVVVSLAASLAFAGDKSMKCSYATQDCLNLMADKMKSSGFVGVELDNKDMTEGYLVKKVFAETPAQAAGLEVGDIMYALNGVVISEANKEQLSRARADWKPGQTVVYTIKRNGADREVSLTLTSVPADIMARWIGEHMLEHAQLDVAKGTENAGK
jgi:C-terminal processing protease CtpA/Prc